MSGRRAGGLWPELRVLFVFELRYLWRDPVALLLTLLLPVIIYPLMMRGFTAATMADQATTAAAELEVVATGATAARLSADGERLAVVPTGALSGEDAVDLVVEVDAGDRPAVLAYRGTAWQSREARRRVEAVLDDWQAEERAARWASAGMPVAPTEVLAVETVDRAGDAVRQALRLGQLLPGMLVFLVMSSGLYVALDLFAGEKERGTLETLLTARVDRRAVLGAKTLVVVLASLASVLSSVAALWLTIQSGFVDLSALGGVDAGLGGATLLWAGLLLSPLSVVLSAILVVGAAWARDHRQGQAIGLPLLLLGAAPATLAAVPDLALGPALGLVPIAGVALAIRDALAGELGLGMGALVMAGALVHAGAGLWVASRLIGREDVLVGGGGARRDPERQGRAAVGVYLVALVLFLFLGQLAQARDLLWGLAFSQVVLLGGVALGGAFVRNQALGPLWQLRWPRLPDLGLAVVVGLACTGLGDLVQALQAPLLPTSSAYAEAFAESLELDLPLWAVVVVFALQPAIFEELLFRGTLLGLFRRSLPRWAQALVVGLMFGFFHLSIYRVFTTGTLGVVLTVAALRSGSLVVPTVVHFLNNAVLMVLSAGALGWTLGEAGFPWWWRLTGAAVAVGGVALMGRRGPSAQA